MKPTGFRSPKPSNGFCSEGESADGKTRGHIKMNRWRLSFALGLALYATTPSARSHEPAMVTTGLFLAGLTQEDAISLIARLRDAQGKLRADEFQAFELTSGSIASYEMTKISPRDAFLLLPFESAWKIERISTKKGPHPTYRLFISPQGLGQLYWRVDVSLGFSGSIERIAMSYRPPAPP